MMKYYLVTETYGEYHIDYVSQKLVAAEEDIERIEKKKKRIFWHNVLNNC